MKKMTSLSLIALIAVVVTIVFACKKSTTTPTTTPGPLFTAAKAIISANNKCASAGCHVAGTGRVNFTVEANIVAQAATIYSKVNAGTMPTGGVTITTMEKQAILDWSVAGKGKITD